jgi:hypothetical protein
MTVSPGGRSGASRWSGIVRRYGWAIGVAAVVLVAVVVWASLPSRGPDPKSSPIKLARYVNTSDYKALQEADKRPYMKALRSATPQITEAFRNRQISQQEYEAAYLNAWMERQLDHMGDYFKQPAAKRDQFLLVEYVQKAKAPAASSTAKAPEPSDAAEEQFIKERLAQWPQEQRAKWEEYRSAVKRAKEKAKTLR